MWWCSAGGLGHLTDKLQENSLAAVRILSKRYAEMAKGPSSPPSPSRPLPKLPLEKVEKGWKSPE